MSDQLRRHVDPVLGDLTRSAGWTGTRKPLREATGLPPKLYTDVAIHQLEQERVFERAWVCIGLACEAVDSGTILVRTLGRRSILVTVDQLGVRRAFLNTCRHRGTELAETDCRVRGTIRCPYHRWGYSLDGSLVSTPRFDPETKPGFDPSDTGLFPVRVDAFAGLLFACLDPTTVSLATWLGDLPDRLALYELESWVVADTAELDIDANWKLITENYQECYHLPWVHPDLATVSRVEDHYRYQGPGMYCGQTTTPISDDDGASWLGLPAKDGLDESDSISGRHLAIFPNVMISITPNHAFVIRLEPDGPARTKETCTWLVPSSVDGQPERAAGFAAIRRFWVEVNAEDVDIVERGQRGLSSAPPDPGPLVPRFEEPLHRFHNMLADHFVEEALTEHHVPPGDEADTMPALRAQPNPHPPAIELRKLRSEKA